MLCDAGGIEPFTGSVASLTGRSYSERMLRLLHEDGALEADSAPLLSRSGHWPCSCFGTSWTWASAWGSGRVDQAVTVHGHEFHGF